MTRFEFSVEIAAPVDRVAAFFVPQRMPYWYGAEMEMNFEVLAAARGAADFQAGQKVRLSGTLRGREVSLVAVVTRYEPGRALEWRFQDPYGVKGLQRWEIISTLEGRVIPAEGCHSEPAAAGEESQGSVSFIKTRVRMIDEYQPPGGFITAFVMRLSVAARDRAWLRKLKQLSERA